MDKEAAARRQKDIFENYPVPKAVMSMAVPTVISQLIILIYNMADTWFIGLTNDPYKVAGCSIVMPLFMLSIIISNLFGTGGGTLVSRLLGVKDNDEAKKVSAYSLWMTLAITVVYSLTCLLAMEPILRFLGASDNIIGYSRQYTFFVIVVGGIPTILSSCMATIIRSVGSSKEASFGLSMGGLINIALDPLFMFVILPPGQQVMGAAIATCLSNCCAFAYYVVIYSRLAKAGLVDVDIRRGLPRKDSVRKVFAVGVPAALAALLFDILNMTMNKLASGHGDLQLAAIGIVLKVERLPLNIGIGISLGMVPLVAYNFSSGNHKRMKD
ncbi:MAG: polysaccharide biosynthesis C-terminal domain-containing protein, partial [Firmicutes bacterium]|nr:polysaccharide biosynthesis C-terminal domain-containing protein [Bacillota bacterium]